MIFNSDNKKAKTPATPGAHPLSEIQRKEISIRLKSVDKLIKDGNLEEARGKLETVRTMDPKNGYILALEERIEELQKARDNPKSVESPKASAESPVKNEIEQKAETEYLERLAEEVQKVEERLETEYRDRFMEEIDKSEQRIAELIKQERERHDAEKAALIENFDKEKEKLLKESKKETKRLLDVEFKKAEDSYRKLLEDKVRKAEDLVRVEISALYEKAIAELKDSVTKDKSQLLDVERKALIEETKKRTQDELQKRFMDELARVKTAFASDAEEHEEGERVPLRTDVKEESETGTKHVEGQMEVQPSKLEKAREERYRRSIQEARDTRDVHLPEVKQSDPKSKVEIEGKPEKASEELYRKSIQRPPEAPDVSIPEVGQNDPKSKTEIESKSPEMQKESATDLGIKTEEQLERERELRDKLREMEFQNIRNGVDWKDRPRKKKG